MSAIEDALNLPHGRRGPSRSPGRPRRDARPRRGAPAAARRLVRRQDRRHALRRSAGASPPQPPPPGGRPTLKPATDETDGSRRGETDSRRRASRPPTTIGRRSARSCRPCRRARRAARPSCRVVASLVWLGLCVPFHYSAISPPPPGTAGDPRFLVAARNRPRRLAASGRPCSCSRSRSWRAARRSCAPPRAP